MQINRHTVIFFSSRLLSAGLCAALLRKQTPLTLLRTLLFYLPVFRLLHKTLRTWLLRKVCEFIQKSRNTSRFPCADTFQHHHPILGFCNRTMPIKRRTRRFVRDCVNDLYRNSIPFRTHLSSPVGHARPIPTWQKQSSIMGFVLQHLFCGHFCSRHQEAAA